MIFGKRRFLEARKGESNSSLFPGLPLFELGQSQLMVKVPDEKVVSDPLVFSVLELVDFASVKSCFN